MNNRRTFCVLFAGLLVPPLPSHAAAPWFEIKVIDQDTGRGVPLVKLETVSHDRYFTDSAGVVAFNEPAS